MLEAAWAEWEIENKDDLLIPDETLLDPRLRKAIKDAWENPEKESAVADLWEEIIPGVYVAQFFDLDRLADFRKYLEAVANSGVPKRAPYGIQLNRYGMMLDPRSEGHLAAPNFQAFYTDMMDRYMRPIARLLLGTYGYDNQTFGFSIQYNPDKDKDLRAHTDASSATLNININLPEEKFTGSEVDFYDKASGKMVQAIFEPGKASSIEVMCHTQHTQLLADNVVILWFGCTETVWKYHVAALVVMVVLITQYLKLLHQKV